MSEQPEPENTSDVPDGQRDSDEAHDEQDVVGPDDTQAEGEARRFSFAELRKHRNDKVWLDANPGAREAIERLAETVRRISQTNVAIPESTVRAIQDAARMRANVPKVPNIPNASAAPSPSALPPSSTVRRTTSPAPADPFDLSKAIVVNPAYKTNEILTTQVEVLQGLVLAQDAQLQHMKDEAAKGEQRAVEQKNDTRRSHTVIVWTLVAAFLTLVATVGLGIATLILSS